MLDPYIYRGPPALRSALRVGWRQSKRALSEIWATGDSLGSRLGATADWFGRQTRRAFETVGGLLNAPRRGEPQPAPEVPEWVPKASRPLAVSLLQAQAKYQYRPYDGPVVFLQGTERDGLLDFLNADDLNGWKGLFTGPLTRHEIAAGHLSMMREPVAAEVALMLTEFRRLRQPDDVAFHGANGEPVSEG